MVDIQHIECKNQQKRLQIAEISFHKWKSGQGIELRCRNFHRKLINSRFCARAVKVWLKIALNAAKSPKFETHSRKLWSPRTIVVTDLPSHSRLTWFCAHADSYVVFHTRSHTILGDNSIYFNRTVQPCKLLSEWANRGQRCCKRIFSGILWEITELMLHKIFYWIE